LYRHAVLAQFKAWYGTPHSLPDGAGDSIELSRSERG